MNLEGKTYIITGASSGLGRATSITLSNYGANVVLIGRNQDELEQTQAQMKPGQHTILAFDLTDFEAYKDHFKPLKEKYPEGIHGLAHFSGHRITKPIKVQNPDDLKSLFDIHVIAFCELIKWATKKNIGSPEGGSIVAVSSVASQRGAKAISGYAAAKGALNSIVPALALELAEKNIRINGILPGHIETEMNLEVAKTLPEEALKHIENAHPLGFGQPNDISEFVAFLLSDNAKWITGALMPVDGGFLVHE